MNDKNRKDVRKVRELTVVFLSFIGQSPIEWSLMCVHVCTIAIRQEQRCKEESVRCREASMKYSILT